jgi:hypothetical protein
MFIWGLVMAKAKTASTSKDQSVVTSSYSKMVGLAVMIGVASLAKWNADSHFLDKMV